MSNHLRECLEALQDAVRTIEPSQMTHDQVMQAIDDLDVTTLDIRRKLLKSIRKPPSVRDMGICLMRANGIKVKVIAKLHNIQPSRVSQIVDKCRIWVNHAMQDRIGQDRDNHETLSIKNIKKIYSPMDPDE